MRRRHAQNLPRIWMMTDERMGDGLWAALRSLPKGSGVIFRHYSLTEKDRRALFLRVKQVARKNRLMLVLAGQQKWRSDGRHGAGRHGAGRGCLTAPVHSVPQRVAAERVGARLILVSPVYSTNSHPGTAPLGRVRFGLLIRAAKCPVIALGGMTQKRANALSSLGIYGWAAIDAFTGQKRIEVPT